MATVLLVEDNRDIRETLTDILEYEGYGVIEASHGREALTLLQDPAARPDVILLDLVMPVMSGPEFLDALRAEHGSISIPIIVCSGTLEDRVLSRLAPHAACLRKPIDVTELLALLAAHDPARQDPKQSDSSDESLELQAPSPS